MSPPEGRSPYRERGYAQPAGRITHLVKKAFPLRVVLCLALAFAVIGGVVAAGAVLRDDNSEGVQVADAATTTTTTTLPPTTTTTLPPTTTTTLPPIPPFAQPGWGSVTGPGPGVRWGTGARGPQIQAVEQRLADLKFDPGPIDGVFDQMTRYAMETFQKSLGGIPTGSVTDGDVFAMNFYRYAEPHHGTAEGNRTEIDIARQVITLYENYQVRLITTTSTASGEEYCYITPKKAPTQRICEHATTPSGRYTYYLFRSGWDDGDLGALYNPYYFNKGRAIHGYESVPTKPASHGCARIPMYVSEYWHTLVHDGDAVYVDGGPPGEEIISTTPI
jgi:peptidoglycan hydrolase-like protein with peptidoglycan-binding domain